MKHIPFRQDLFPVFPICLVLLLLLNACGSTTSSSSAPKGTVSAAYAASLSNIMEQKVKTAFQKAQATPIRVKPRDHQH